VGEVAVSRVALAVVFLLSLCLSVGTSPARAAVGTGARIGLVSMGGDGFTATFDYVRTWKLRN
jgi:hypothetical protein